MVNQTIMEKLFEKYQQKLRYTSTDFVRSRASSINWNARLIGIKGARGVGKTTLLLQYIKLNLTDELEKTLYVSLDDLWFSKNSLVSLAEEFTKRGGVRLFVDEVHKYPNWSQEIKNIYDDFPSLKVVFTGSSSLEIINASADLSRRAVVYHMQGLSFREYIGIETGLDLPMYSFSELLVNHVAIANDICGVIKPFQYFNSYLTKGYYPFYKEQIDLYYMRIEEVVKMMLELELPMLRGVDLAYVPKLKQLLLIISESVPFIPNVSRLSEKMGINRATLLMYFHYLDEIGLSLNLFKKADGISKLQKPNKVFMENTNLMYALASTEVNIGSVRETFFVNQLRDKHKVNFAAKGDFIIDGLYVFEVGGKNKTDKQVRGIEHAYVVSDDIECGFQNKIPLWLFGFLY